MSVLASEHTGNVPDRPDFKHWLVRRVECLRGHVDVNIEVLPAFGKSRSELPTQRI
jgi:hypothetical protein